MATENEPSQPEDTSADDIAAEMEVGRQSGGDGDGDLDDSDDDEPGLDLDAFLTSIEGRLRGPFSSLELAKAVMTPSFRGPSSTATAAAARAPCSAARYVRRIARVLGRTDKRTQLQILMALLGVAQHASGREAGADGDEEREAERLHAAMAQLLGQAQEAPTYDEWVRVVAGIVQGMLVQPTSPEERVLDTEARRVIDKTCKEIIQRVKSLIKQTEKYESDGSDDDGGDKDDVAMSARGMTADADPTLAPFYYALLPPTLLEQVIPETMSQNNFRVNEEAEVLLVDARLDQQKALDEQEHAAATFAMGSGATVARVPINNNGKNEAAANPSKDSDPDVPTASTAPRRPQQPPPIKKKSSMFLMPARPTAAPNRPPVAGSSAGRVPPTALHARKAGAAQALLRSRAAGTHRRGEGTGATGAGSTSWATTKPSIALASGSARPVHLQRSKLKMIDVTEVKNQFQKQQQQQTAMETGMRGKKKRKADTEADEKEQSKQKMPRTATVTAEPTTAQDEAADVAAAALSAYQQGKNGVLRAEADGNSAVRTAGDDSSQRQQESASHSLGPRQQDWRQMLKEKSNRLTPEDRFRIEQFFSSSNQNDQQSGVVKIKLHEERLPDRKETYYLELDHDNRTSKQSKKTKRYTNCAEQG